MECEKCGKAFRNKSHLRDHIKLVHVLKYQKNFECPTCFGRFKCQNYLLTHIRRVHETNHKFKCTECKKKYKRLSHLNEHIKRKHGEPESHECEFCLKTFQRKYSLSHHIRQYHSKSTVKVQCNYCGKLYGNKFDLSRHINSLHMQIKSNDYLVCKICLKRFTTKKTLVEHRDIFHRQKLLELHKCDQCESKYKYMRTLLAHRRIAHNPNATRYYCDLCPKIYNLKLTLRSHMLIHHKFSSLKCEKCMKRFLSLGQMAEHMKIHEENYKPPDQNGSTEGHTCDRCGRRYTHYRSLRDHMRWAHILGAPMFICDHCGKECTQKMSLKQHILVMHKFSPHKCESCDQYFSKEVHLSIHKKKHKRLEYEITRKLIKAAKKNKVQEVKQSMIDDHLNIKATIQSISKEAYVKIEKIKLDSNTKTYEVELNSDKKYCLTPLFKKKCNVEQLNNYNSNKRTTNTANKRGVGDNSKVKKRLAEDVNDINNMDSYNQSGTDPVTDTKTIKNEVIGSNLNTDSSREILIATITKKNQVFLPKKHGITLSKATKRDCVDTNLVSSSNNNLEILKEIKEEMIYGEEVTNFPIEYIMKKEISKEELDDYPQYENIFDDVTEKTEEEIF